MFIVAKKRSSFGFSLLELIIYIAIISSVLVVSVFTALNVSNLRSRAEAQAEVEYSARFMNSVMARIISESAKLDSATSLLDDHYSRLALVDNQDSSLRHYLSADAATKRVVLDINGLTPENLTVKQVSVDKFLIHLVGARTIKLELTLSKGQPSDGKYQFFSENFNYVYQLKADN